MSDLKLYIIDAQIVDAFLDVIVDKDDQKTREVIKKLLRIASVIPLPEKQRISFKNVNDLIKLSGHLEDFCYYNEVSPEQLQSKSRKRHLVKLRIAFYQDSRRRGFDSGLIAKMLNRDHTTMANYTKKQD